MFLKRLGTIHGTAVHGRRARVLATHFAEIIPHGHRVLDIGCGDGLVSALLLECRPDLEVAGVDVLPRNSARIPVAWFDGRHLPFEADSWDTAIFCDVLHHTPDPVEMLKEAARVTRSTVVIKDHVVRGFLARPTLRFMDFVGNAPHGVALPYNYFTERQWADAFRTCGYEPRTVRRVLNLYPLWADLLFGRSLHFLGAYEAARAPAAGRHDGERP